MKIQKRLSRIYKGKKYYKYLVGLSEKDLKKSKLKEGDELDVFCKDKEISLKKQEKLISNKL